MIECFSAWNRVLPVLFLSAMAAVAQPVFSDGSAQSPMRVVIAENPSATSHFLPVSGQLGPMVEDGLTRLTGLGTTASAWRSLFSSNDIIGIKVYSAPGNQSGTRPDVVAAVVESLLAAGFPPRNILIWDKQLSDLSRSGFVELGKRLGVRVAGSIESGFDAASFYENSILGTPVWGDLEFGKKGEAIGRKSHVTTLLTRDITKIISIAPLLNHNHAGVTGHLYSLALGSVDNAIRFENNPDRLATAVPEICAVPELFDRMTLFITDALICQYQGEQRSLLHYSTALNQLRFSRDPVALDVLSAHELEQQRRQAESPLRKPKLDLFRNASLLELGISDPAKIRVERAGKPEPSKN